MTALNIPPGPTVSTHPDVPLADRCSCGAMTPVACVSWWNDVRNMPDWDDVCPLCVGRGVERAYDTGGGRWGVDVEIRRVDEQAVAA